MDDPTNSLPLPPDPPRVKLDNHDMRELTGYLEAIRGQGDRYWRERQGKPTRRSTDPLERIEWQLDQIRVHTLIIAAFFSLAFLGAVLSLLSAS